MGVDPTMLGQGSSTASTIATNCIRLVSRDSLTVHAYWPERFLMCSRIPAWKRLTGHERISLITKIFSDRDVIGVIERLRGDDAQFFVDMVDKVFPSFIPERASSLN